MTTEDTTIDFAEDGRLLAAATPPATHCASGMRVECRRGFGSHADDISAMVALRNHAAAYREAVLAAKAVADNCGVESLVLGETFSVTVPVDKWKAMQAALARFRNITEGQS